MSSITTLRPVSCCLGPALSLNLYLERVKAGFPSPAEGYAEEILDLNRLAIQNPCATYFLRVSGLSMINAGIYPDDILIVDRSLTSHNRDIVVAEVEGAFTVKRLCFEAGVPYLLPENPAFSPIYFKEGQELVLFGVVSGVYRKLR